LIQLVQLLLPFHDNRGRKFAPAKLNEVKQFLAQRFDGVTVFKRGDWSCRHASSTTAQRGVELKAL